MFGRTLPLRRDAARYAALDALRASVMIADKDLNITYVNRSLLALLRGAASEFKAALPEFDISRPIGVNIGLFHPEWTRQRPSLLSLKAPQAAPITIGGRPFDLLVTPLDQDGRRLGFCVEWADARPRLENLDYAEQMNAIRKHQAVIYFDPDGRVLDANENFLSLMGYRANEVVGHAHRMFVEAAYADTPDYRRFWDRLRTGESLRERFKRVRKDGSPIWIEGAYNPIIGPDGEIQKIVKFAVDVSAQVQLMNRLSDLIQQNFAEIDQAINLSTAEAGSAAAAVGETAANVQSVAASSEELAQSISEIARGMATSRSATEGAFDRIVAVGRNTEALTEAAGAMNGIVTLIREVASQINLLSLNATIESARAGEAGKGFAVVASEVKSLAVQASKATERISHEIEGIQATSRDVAGAMAAIRDAVTTVRDSIVLAAVAVEQQSVVTRDMSANMQSAAGSVSTVSSNVTEISSAVSQVASAVSKTRQAAAQLAS